MKALVAGIVLRMTGERELGRDAQLDPPDVQARQAPHRQAGEGSAVVGADGLRQPKLAEEALEDRLHGIVERSFQALAAQQEAAVAIQDRQREAHLSVSHPELAFEVSRPQTIGMGRDGAAEPGMARPRPAATGFDQAMAAQDVGDGAAGRPQLVRRGSHQVVPDLSRAPVAMAPPDPEDDLFGLGRSPVWAGLGRTRPIFQTFRTFVPKALEPLVPCLGAHPKEVAELHDGEILPAAFLHKPQTLSHGPGLSPGHRAPPRRPFSPRRLSPMYLDSCYPCTRTVPTDH